jgi:serine/threonine-protein kinase
LEARAELSGKGSPTRHIGRYALFGEIASGGMATVYFGRLVGAVGFSRSVAIKQLHPQYAKSPEFVAQFLDEAQLASRVRHPNVVSVLDVVARDGELFVVMEFVEGEPLARLVRFSKGPLPIPVASAILVQVLLGLHAAHEATTESGEPLEIVHRDVSPQNLLVGVDGTAHVLDFGVAKAASKLHTTENGQIKGKLSYMSPEQLRGDAVDRRADVFAAGVVLWELLTGEALFARNDPGATVTAILSGMIKPPSELRPEISRALEVLVLKALNHPREGRFDTARDMAIALEACVPPASSLTVGAWVASVAGDSLKERAERLRQAEENTGVSVITNVESLRLRLADDGRLLQDGSATSADPADGKTYQDRQSTWVRRNRALPWLRRGGVAALLLALLALAVFVMRPARVAVEASLPSAPLPPGPMAPVAPLSEAPPASQPPAEAPATAAPIPPAAPAAVRHVPKKAPETELGGANCKPPYVLDAQGRKRFKPECF